MSELDVGLWMAPVGGGDNAGEDVPRLSGAFEARRFHPPRQSALLHDGSARLQNTLVYDWNDLRFFLAVARTGSTLAAARAMNVNQTTVARRIGMLERAIGMKLFDKRQIGYAPTEAGVELRAMAERVEVEANAFAAQAEAIERRVAGVIRVTTNEGLANHVMAPALSVFRKLYPDVRVDLVVDERRLDLMRGAADVALRTGPRSIESGLVARRLTPMAWAAYCSRDYAERRGWPSSVEALGRHPVIGADGPIAALPGWTWLQKAAPGSEVAARSSSLTNLIAAVKAGLGIAVLPCFLVDSDPGLVRCIGPITGVQSDLWLVTREGVRNVRRVRAFVDFLAAHVAALRPLLAGEARSHGESAEKRGPSKTP